MVLIKFVFPTLVQGRGAFRSTVVRTQVLRPLARSASEQRCRSTRQVLLVLPAELISSVLRSSQPTAKRRLQLQESWPTFKLTRD